MDVISSLPFTYDASVQDFTYKVDAKQVIHFELHQETLVSIPRFYANFLIKATNTSEINSSMYDFYISIDHILPVGTYKLTIEPNASIVYYENVSSSHFIYRPIELSDFQLSFSEN